MSPQIDNSEHVSFMTLNLNYSNVPLFTILQVFKVIRDGEEDRLKVKKGLGNCKLLWHGSRVTNFAGILSQGLRIAPPEAPSVSC